MTRLNRVSILCSVLSWVSATGLAAETTPELQPEGGFGGWRLSGGLMHRSLDNVSFRTGSRVSQDMIPRKSSSDLVDASSRFGGEDSFADREYDDGYVRQDAGTALFGDTWYWGYDTREQIQGDTLVFHGAAGRQTSVDQRTRILDGRQSDQDDENGGLYIKVAKEVLQRGAVSFHLFFSGSYVPFSVGTEGSTLDVRQQSVTYGVEVVDTYDLMGVIPPDSPYSGNAAGPGPLLPNTPVNREIRQHEVSRSETRYFNDIREELDISLTTLSLGLQCEWDADWIQLIVAAGPSLNMVRSDGERVEVLMRNSGGLNTTEQRFNDSADDVDYQFGAFAQAGMRFPLSERFGLELCGQYEILDSVEGRLGPSSYKVDFERLSLLAMLSVAW